MTDNERPFSRPSFVLMAGGLDHDPALDTVMAGMNDYLQERIRREMELSEQSARKHLVFLAGANPDRLLTMFAACFGDVAEEVNRRASTPVDRDDVYLRRNLQRVQAVADAWIEGLDAEPER